MKNKGLSILISLVLVGSIFVLATMMQVQAPSGTLNLSNNAAFSGLPKIAVNGDTVHVVWVDEELGVGNTEIFYKRSLNNGVGFEGTINVSNTEGSSVDAQIAENGEFVFIVWVEDEDEFLVSDGITDIMFSRSIDNGATFESPVALSSSSVDAFAPKIAATSSALSIVWRDTISGDDEIQYRRSTDNGATFDPSLVSDPLNISDTVIAGSSINPRVAMYGGNVYVAWADNFSGNDEIYLRKSTDFGATFTPAPGSDPVTVSNSPAGDSIIPEMAISASTNSPSLIVHVVWLDNDPAFGGGGNDVVVYGRSMDNGVNFNTAEQEVLSDTLNDSSDPRIGVSGDVVSAVWRESLGGFNEIFYNRSIDDGATFLSAELENISGTALFDSLAPELFVFATNVFVMYKDNSPGDFDIFIKRSINDGEDFGLAVNISNSSGTSDFGEVASTSSFHSVYGVYRDNTDGDPDVYILNAVLPLAVQAFMTDSAGNDLNSFDSVI
ncbi:MAG: sialidase family protein, partial [Nitrososphaerales archaeon]